MLTAKRCAGYLSVMSQEQNDFDPSSVGGEHAAPEAAETKPKVTWVPLRRADVGDNSRIAAKTACAAAGVGRVGEVHGVFSGAGASSRAEAARTVRRAKKAAIAYYTDPGKLGELGEKLSVLLSDYGVKEPGDIDHEAAAKVSQGLEFGDDGEKAVYTRMLVDIYNGALANLRKAGKNSGDRSFLKAAGTDGELEDAPVTAELKKAYRDATKRDKNYVWALETDRDGRRRVVRKNAPTLGDWGRKTVDGMTGSANVEEGIGYLLGSSLRAMIRLIPGLGEVEGKDQLRAEAARLYQQVESLVPSRKTAVHPHTSPGAKAAEGGGEDTPGAAGGGEHKSLSRPSGGKFEPGMSGLGHGGRDARHVGG